jgi:alkylation response protein AidB-like acyl-CoA dehydrogenase
MSDDFGFTATAFRREVSLWLDANAPLALVGVSVDSSDPEHQLLLDEFADLLYKGGFQCLTWPEEYGGRGFSDVEVAVLCDELAQRGLPRATRGVGEWLVAPAILAWGTEAQKARLLPRILDGTDRYCQGFSEPDAGSDLAALRTAAKVDGNDLVISGQKIWTSFTASANVMFCLCRTDLAQSRHAGISFAIVPMRHEDGSSNGISFQPIRQMSGDADFTVTFLDDARTPLENVIGGLNNGWRVTMTTLGSERGGQAAVQHLPFLSQFWDAVAIARASGANQDPRVRQELAWAYSHVQIMRYLGLATLSDAIHGREPGARASISKMFWSEYSQRFLDRVANLRGAQAMLVPAQPADSYEPDYWNGELLKSRASTIWGGTAEVQRNIVAERVLGLPKD